MMTTTNADDDLHDDMVWASSSRDGDGISRDDDDARARVMRAPCILDDGVRLVVDDGDTVRARARRRHRATSIGIGIGGPKVGRPISRTA